jgi:hypothetical protein
MDESEFRSDLCGASGEASGAKAAATMNTVKEKSAKRVEGEYARFIVRDKNGDGPPDVPKQAILQDGMYWVPKGFDFRQWHCQRGNKPSGGEKQEKALIARAATSMTGGTTVNMFPNPEVDDSKTEDQGSTPSLKECNQERREEKITPVAQQDKLMNEEKCLIANSKSMRTLSLIVDCACTNTMVGDKKVLQNLIPHESSIKGVHKDLLPLHSSLRGIIKGYVLSQNGMLPFPEDLPVIHSNDTAPNRLPTGGEPALSRSSSVESTTSDYACD